ncbi:zinc-binding dehydrogenase [Agromyces sp. MMS24-K17]|uniref:zinc-binding dehydrogenase n=1 Tax=Agromyces sp. MMS24-K17 TaxID=3372850 RepID=UPI0037551DA1
MHAALVTSLDAAPTYAVVPDPVAADPDELVVEVLAAALHPLVRSRAAGSHYTSGGRLPLVPGIDAVVRDDLGHLHYALLDDTELGTMADRTVIERRRSIPLPDDVDPVRVAAALNPAMSSWVALTHRIEFEPGARVLVTGATGNSGRMAVQIAKRFGASEVVAAGRDTAKLAELPALGADRTITLDRLAEASEVDVVLDYLWGEPTATGLVDLLRHRSDRRAPLTWVQIGSVAGASAPIPSAALRSARLQLVGSGLGSVGADEFRAELGRIVDAIVDGAVDVRARAVPLADVEATWTSSLGDAERVVFVP